jgi:hypothetical protein
MSKAKIKTYKFVPEVFLRMIYPDTARKREEDRVGHTDTFPQRKPVGKSVCLIEVYNNVF